MPAKIPPITLVEVPIPISGRKTLFSAFDGFHMTPIYQPKNCSVAYQLNWSLSVFGQSYLPSPESVMFQLQAALEKDRLRILEYRMLRNNVAQFFISSRPQHSPSAIVRAIKGRWQYAARCSEWIYFRRNYRIESLGSAKQEVMDDYIAGQTVHHPMVDAQLQTMFESIQFHDPSVDSTELRRGNYGEFVYGLHLVLESALAWRETREEVLCMYRDMIVGACRKHGWWLSRIGLLNDHMHILLSPSVNESPESVALSLMNNLAFTQKLSPVLRFSYYCGTVGRYDRGVIWNSMEGVSEGRECFAVG